LCGVCWLAGGALGRLGAFGFRQMRSVPSGIALLASGLLPSPWDCAPCRTGRAAAYVRACLRLWLINVTRHSAPPLPTPLPPLPPQRRLLCLDFFFFFFSFPLTASLPSTGTGDPPARWQTRVGLVPFFLESPNAAPCASSCCIPPRGVTLATLATLPQPRPQCTIPPMVSEFFAHFIFFC
jgi:hypothetical protein